METRARYALIGLFMLAAAVAGFGFVYWLHHTGGLGERASYRIRFENFASGLRSGSAVLFNGIRVGEVTDVRLNPADPREVTVTIAVEQNTPVRADTRAEIYVQGLMGSPAISLLGGTSTAPALTISQGKLPLLMAEPTAGQDVMQGARELIRRIDKVVAENADALRSMIANLNTFSSVLARNSDRLDTMIEGLVRWTSGSQVKAPPTVYDLTAPRVFPGLAKIPSGQLAVPEVSAVLGLDTQRILTQSTVGEAPAFPDTQWSDSLPKLLQAKIIQSFENAKLPRVGRASEGFAADYQLLVDLRNFRLSISADPVAEVEFGAKILGPGGRIIGARTFLATSLAKAVSAPAAAAALDEAFGKAVTELVLWTSGAM